MKLLTLLLVSYVYAVHASGNEPLLSDTRMGNEARASGNERLSDTRMDNEAHDVQGPEAHDVQGPEAHDVQGPEAHDVPDPEAHNVQGPEAHDERDPTEHLVDALKEISAAFPPSGLKLHETLIVSEVGWELLTHTAELFARPLDKVLSLCNKNTCKKIGIGSISVYNFVKAHPLISIAAAIVGFIFFDFKHAIASRLTDCATSWIELPKPVRFLLYMIINIFIRLPLATVLPMYAAVHALSVEVLEMNTDNPSAMWTLAYSMLAAFPACLAPAALTRDQLLKVFKVIVKSPQVFWVASASVNTIITPDWNRLSQKDKTLRMLKGSLLGHVVPASGAVMTAIQPLMIRSPFDLISLGSGGLLDDYAMALVGEVGKNPSKVLVPISVLTVSSQIVGCINLFLQYKQDGMSTEIQQNSLNVLVTLFVSLYILGSCFFTNPAEMTVFDAFYVAMSTFIGNIFGKIATLVYTSACRPSLDDYQRLA